MEKTIQNLTVPPIELRQMPTSKKKPKKLRRRPMRKRRQKKDTTDLVSRKSPSKSSENRSTMSSSLESELYDYENERISPVRSMFASLIRMTSAGHLVFLPVTFFHQRCTIEEASLKQFDNMVAYVVTIVSFGCIVFSRDVQTTTPYNTIYTTMFNWGLSYMGGKIVCKRDLILMLETAAVVGIELFGVYIIAIYTNKDFTPLTPVLTTAYFCTTLLNILIIYLVRDSVPIVMLSIINICLTFGLALCVAQFPITNDPRFRLPKAKKLFGDLLLYLLMSSLSYHTYLFISAMFDSYGSTKFENYLVNLTFYLEQ